MKLDRPWPERLNVVIGEQIGHFRRARRLTAAQLAERCSELGLPISRSKIANMENGRARQEGVSVAEISIIATALGVPPILLIYPVGREEMTEALPGREVSSWDAAQWFTGKQPLPHEVNGRYVMPPDDHNAWEQSAAPLAYYEEERQLIHARLYALATREEALVLVREEEISKLRRWMRRAGIQPSELPEGLRHVDEETSQ